MANEIKSGVRSSEFWVAAMGVVATAIPAVVSALNGYPKVAVILGAAAVVLPVVYIWGRAILKAEQAKQTNVIPDSWEPILGRVVDMAEALAKALAAAKVDKDKNDG